MTRRRAARRWIDPNLSANCRAQHDMPHQAHQARCTGCPCACHSVDPPANFREIVARQRERARARRDGESA